LISKAILKLDGLDAEKFEMTGKIQLLETDFCIKFLFDLNSIK
jgi:hypothetical protein